MPRTRRRGPRSGHTIGSNVDTRPSTKWAELDHARTTGCGLTSLPPCESSIPSARDRDRVRGRRSVRLSDTTAPDEIGGPMSFRPYLFFGGNCREAFTRYQEIFGGELTLLTMKDAPGEVPPGDKTDMIIHAALTVGDDLLMASDDPRPQLQAREGHAGERRRHRRRGRQAGFRCAGRGRQVTRALARTFSRPPSACASTGSARPGWSSPSSCSSRPDTVAYPGIYAKPSSCIRVRTSFLTSRLGSGSSMANFSEPLDVS